MKKRSTNTTNVDALLMNQRSTNTTTIDALQMNNRRTNTSTKYAFKMGKRRTNITTKCACLVFVFVGVTFCYKTMLLHDKDVFLHDKDVRTVIKEHTEETIKVKVEEKKKHVSRAVIHMGPHKTGTTTIQEGFDRANNYALSKYLSLDRYKMPWNEILRNEGRHRSTKGLQANENQVNFATCFVEETHPNAVIYPCDYNLLLEGSAIASRKDNLFMSAESFSEIMPNELKLLASYLSQWDEVKIIIFYRRYYDWLLSSYGEAYRYEKVTDRQSILEFLEMSHIRTHIHNPYPRLKEHFENIEVVNYHERKSKGDLLEYFYCHSLPDATHTCNAIQSKDSNAVGLNNKSKTMEYEYLAFAAFDAGLHTIDISNDEDLKNILVKAVKDHQEKTLNLTSIDLMRVCPKQHILDQIWNITLTNQRMFFPDPIDESDMKLEFEVLSKTKMCEVDVKSILESKVWRDFFTEMNETIR
jgi:hypothetical protein